MNNIIKIKILLIYDQEIIRCGLRTMLELEEDMEVIGEYSDAQKAFHERPHPDIVLMGAHMPGVNGIEAIRRKNGLDDGVIIFPQPRDYPGEALNDVAKCYHLKDITSVKLTQAIRQIYGQQHLMKERMKKREEEAVELVIPPCADSFRLWRFVYQLEQMIRDSYDTVVQVSGSWNKDTTITILLASESFADFLDELNVIPDVEKVEEELETRATTSSSSKKYSILPKLRISHRKRIRVTLRETGIRSNIA